LIARQDFITLIHSLRTIPESNVAETTRTAATTTMPDTTFLHSSMRWPIQQWNEPINCRDIIDAISTLNSHVGNTTPTTRDTADMATSITPLPVRPLNKKQRKELKKKSLTGTNYMG
jgi:hypothetical protein